MTEKTVQVPESLIEQELRAGMQSMETPKQMARRVVALLSQPTAEQMRAVEQYEDEQDRAIYEREGVPYPEDAWEKAARIAERDAAGVTLHDLSQYPVVQATGSRIAFNIRAASQKETR